jgi:hypothetical protein
VPPDSAEIITIIMLTTGPHVMAIMITPITAPAIKKKPRNWWVEDVQYS